MPNKVKKVRWELDGAGKPVCPTCWEPFDPKTDKLYRRDGQACCIECCDTIDLERAIDADLNRRGRRGL